MDSKSDSLLSRAREGIRLLFWRGSYRPNNKHNRVGSVDLELGKPLGSEKETQEDYALDDIDKVVYLVYQRVQGTHCLRRNVFLQRELPRTTEMIGSLENDRPCLARGLKDLTRSFSTRRPSHEYLSLY
ncbi:hypothetical protein LSAT2_006505 [Lamellibrachia satsuma]|nr:hypothetical protein LSAT2_006505 [Lamellibrachia satsuma]